MVEDEDPDERADARAAGIAAARVLEALDRDGEVAQLTAILQQEAVRDFLWRLLVQAAVFGSTYNRNYGDMAFSEGKRANGLWLLSEIAEADPEALLAMQTKANRLNSESKRQERKKAARKGPRG